jgi:hypothetical protein
MCIAFLLTSAGLRQTTKHVDCIIVHLFLEAERTVDKYRCQIPNETQWQIRIADDRHAKYAWTCYVAVCPHVSAGSSHWGPCNQGLDTGTEQRTFNDLEKFCHDICRVDWHEHSIPSMQTTVRRNARALHVQFKKHDVVFDFGYYSTICCITRS